MKKGKFSLLWLAGTIFIPISIFLYSCSLSGGSLQTSMETELIFASPPGDEGKNRSYGSSAPEQYKISLEMDPARPKAGVKMNLSLSILPGSGRPFPPPDESRPHFTIISRNLEDISLIDDARYEPFRDDQRQGGRFFFPFTFRSGGSYCLITTFLDRGRPVNLYYRIPVDGPRAPRTRWNFNRRRKAGGLTAILKHSPQLIRYQEDKVEFTVKIEDQDGPIKDLEPLAGSMVHVTIAREGCLSVAHLHGRAQDRHRRYWGKGEPAPGGPYLLFEHTFPVDDKFRVFVQFRRKGRDYTLPFDLVVTEEVERMFFWMNDD